jgi:hypothetical protein
MTATRDRAVRLADQAPFRVFSEGPGTLAMTALPWVMVPAILVPLYLLIHFTIAFKLSAVQPTAPAVARAR